MQFRNDLPLDWHMHALWKVVYMAVLSCTPLERSCKLVGFLTLTIFFAASIQAQSTQSWETFEFIDSWSTGAFVKGYNSRGFPGKGPSPSLIVDCDRVWFRNLGFTLPYANRYVLPIRFNGDNNLTYQISVFLSGKDLVVFEGLDSVITKSKFIQLLKSHTTLDVRFPWRFHFFYDSTETKGEGKISFRLSGATSAIEKSCKY